MPCGKSLADGKHDGCPQTLLYKCSVLCMALNLDANQSGDVHLLLGMV